MQIQDFIVADALVSQLKATEHDDVIEELVNALVEAGSVSTDDKQAVIDKILEREKHGSTGFGKGVAVPHAKHENIKKMVATIGISSSGVDFNSLDRAPVYCIFLLLSPADEPDNHLHAMETIFSNLQNNNFRKFLRQAENDEQILDLIQEADTGKLID